MKLRYSKVDRKEPVSKGPVREFFRRLGKRMLWVVPPLITTVAVPAVLHGCETKPETKQISETKQKKLDEQLWKAASDGDVQKIKELLDKGANPDATFVTGATLLYYVSTAGKTEIAKLLIEKGADVNHRWAYPDVIPWANPLMVAALNGHTETVKVLLENGADVNAKNDVGHAPLMLAASEGHIETVKLLLKKGADVNAKGKYEFTALSLASENGHTEIVELLKAHGAIE